MVSSTNVVHFAYILYMSWFMRTPAPPRPDALVTRTRTPPMSNWIQSYPTHWTAPIYRVVKIDQIHSRARVGASPSVLIHFCNVPMPLLPLFVQRETNILFVLCVSLSVPEPETASLSLRVGNWNDDFKPQTPQGPRWTKPGPTDRQRGSHMRQLNSPKRFRSAFRFSICVSDCSSIA